MKIITPLKFNSSAPAKMVVGRLLPYWEGQFFRGDVKLRGGKNYYFPILGLQSYWQSGWWNDHRRKVQHGRGWMFGHLIGFILSESPRKKWVASFAACYDWNLGFSRDCQRKLYIVHSYKSNLSCAIDNVHIQWFLGYHCVSFIHSGWQGLVHQ